MATCLVAAGLPPCYWEMALNCCTLLHNTGKVNGQSSWELTFGEEFQGKRIPFGALVNFKPTSSRKLSTKFGPDTVTGVFAGYSTTSGENWRREYLAWPLVGFKDVDLSVDCPMVPRHLREPIFAERFLCLLTKLHFRSSTSVKGSTLRLKTLRTLPLRRRVPRVLRWLRYISKGYVHYSEGTAGNGNINVDDDADDGGYNVKLDKLGVDDTKSGLVGSGKFPHQTFWGYLQRLGSE